MKKWNRINNSDRKKEKLGKVRFVIPGFMGKNKVNKRIALTVVKL